MLNLFYRKEARRLIAKIESAGERLLKFPLSGTAREQFGAGLRVTFQDNYAVYYIVTETEIILVRVLHGARDAAAIAERGGFL